MGLSPPSRSRLLEIARDALKHKLAGNTKPVRRVESADPELAALAGCFVSLHERSTHRLRGCVGRLDANLALSEAVRQTAGDVLHDPRFTDQAVTADDLANMEIEVSVLSAPRLAESPLDFDPQSDGIYLTCGAHAGFFLPQVARETGWTKEQLLERLCAEKLGLAEDAWRRPESKLYAFSVEIIGPEAL